MAIRMLGKLSPDLLSPSQHYVRGAPSWLVLSPVARERINMRVHGLTPKALLEEVRLKEILEQKRRPVLSTIKHRIGENREDLTWRRAGQSLSALKMVRKEPSFKLLTSRTSDLHLPTLPLPDLHSPISPKVRVERKKLRRVKAEVPVLTPKAWTPDESETNN